MKFSSPQLVLALCLALAACGQKGPLYLPDTKAAEIVTRPTPAPDQNPDANQTPPPAPTPDPAATPPAAPDESDKDKKNGTPPPK